MSQELFVQAQVLQEEFQKLEEHSEIIEKQILELNDFVNSLNHLSKTNEKEIIASIGKGVYVKTNLVEKELFVEVGSGILVKKTPQEAQIIIEDQLDKLNGARTQINGQKEICLNAIKETIAEIEKSKN
jgi:prefoldin alpha subunit